MNIAADQPESRIPPTTAGWTLWCRPALNLPKDIFYIRIRPLDPGDNIMSQKLLVHIGIDLFVGRIHLWQDMPLILLTLLFLPLVCCVRPTPSFSSFFTLKTSLLSWDPRKSSSGAFLCTARSDELVLSNVHGNYGSAHPAPPIYTIAWTTAYWILLILPLTDPQWCQQRAGIRYFTIHRPPVDVRIGVKCNVYIHV